MNEHMTENSGLNQPKQTALYDKHRESGAKLVDFAGWEMPINYGSQIKEHNQVRTDAGMFDVSHMVILDLKGKKSQDFLRYLLANDVAKLKEPGKALYSAMLNQDGGVIDDLIVYYLADDWYRIVVNAATRDKDLDWIKARMDGFELELRERDDLSMIAVQGPKAREKVLSILPEDQKQQINQLKPFFAVMIDDTLFARTGYTGEDGFEIMLPNEKAPGFWDQLLASHVKPIGLGARDTLRLEAGMNLYGTDMDESVSPLESGMAWTIAWEPSDREFIGRAALQQQRADGIRHKLVGLVLEDRGVLRGHQTVYTDKGKGEITSGSFSPTLGVAIALARIPAQSGRRCEVEIRGKRLAAKIVKPPFVRNGQSQLD